MPGLLEGVLGHQGVRAYGCGGLGEVSLDVERLDVRARC